MENKLYPIDVFVYNHIKFFTEKGDGYCCQSNEKIAKEVGRHKVNVSRSISKLCKLGYIKVDKENGRKLSSVKEISIKSIDNPAKEDDKIAMLVDILAMDFDKNAMEKLINSLRGIDNLAKHNIEFKLRYLNNIYGKKKNNYPTREEVEEYAKSRNRLDLANKFYDYYTAGNWQGIKNWKQKFITWESHNEKPKENKIFIDNELRAKL